MTRLKTIVLVAATALAATAVGVGYAAIPSANGTITACRDTKGSLKVIDAEAGQTCNANQQSLTWNQQGPAGPEGPQGPSAIHAATTSAQGPPNPSSTLQFLATPAEVTVPTAGTRVLVVAERGFGAGGLGANSLNLWVCYQLQGLFNPITPVGNGIIGLNLPASTRVPMGINRVLTLAPGAYRVGMCGTGGIGWTNNDWGTTTAVVFDVG